jgi:hypothetical protein
MRSSSYKSLQLEFGTLDLAMKNGFNCFQEFGFAYLERVRIVQ